MKITARMKLKFTLMALSACSLGSSAPLCAAPPEISIARDERKQVIGKQHVYATAMLSSEQDLLGSVRNGNSPQALGSRASQGPKGLVIRTAEHILPPIGMWAMDVRPAVKILT